MAWYDTGTISVTNGSTTVTGSGTNFLTGAQIGEAFLGPDDKLYEIASITSATVLVLADGYLGSTQSGQAYKIVPTQSLVADLASDVTDLISDYATVKDNAGAGKFLDGTVASPSIKFEQDQDLGFYRVGNNELGVAVGGVLKGGFDSDGLTMGDNVKAKFGAGDDLQIYHTGSHSYVRDEGTGGLILSSNGPAVYIQKGDTETIAEFGVDGAVKLRHDNAEKFVTTSTGIDVTGTVTADGLVVSGPASTLVTFDRTGSNGAYLNLADNSGSNVYLGNSGGQFQVQTAGAGYASKLTADSNGDISFYEDTGTTPKFFWDASAESLGIGTNTPSGAIDVVSSGTNSQIIAEFSSASGIRAKIATDAGDDGFMYLYDASNANTVSLRADGNSSFINGGGNFGIGTSLPAYQLEVGDGTSSSETVNIKASSSGTSNLFFSDNSNGQGRLIYDHAINALKIYTADAEKMRIDASGNVGIGTSSPATALDVTGAVTATGALDAASALIGPAGYNVYIRNVGGVNRIDSYNDPITATVPLQLNASQHTFYIADAEKMRITNNGDLIISPQGVARANNANCSLVTDGVKMALAIECASHASYIAIQFRNGGTQVGAVVTTPTTTAYNTSSDYRLKTNVLPMTGATATFKQLKPCNFEWIADGTRVDGFLAHELQEVIPAAATGTKDAMMDEEYEVTPAVYEDVITPAVDAVDATFDAEGVELTPAVEAVAESTESVLVTEAVMGTRSVPDMQGIDQSKIVPLLTAALQEAIAKIESLETRLTALEEA